jgi:hypothetical protein
MGESGVRGGGLEGERREKKAVKLSRLRNHKLFKLHGLVAHLWNGREKDLVWLQHDIMLPPDKMQGNRIQNYVWPFWGTSQSCEPFARLG